MKIDKDITLGELKKTYKEDFLKKFPKGRIEKGEPIRVCRRYVYGGECLLGSEGCTNCIQCWNEVMKDD